MALFWTRSALFLLSILQPDAQRRGLPRLRRTLKTEKPGTDILEGNLMCAIWARLAVTIRCSAGCLSRIQAATLRDHVELRHDERHRRSVGRCVGRSTIVHVRSVGECPVQGHRMAEMSREVLRSTK